MNCIDFFCENNKNNNKCKLLQKYEKNTLISWETEKASEYSLCPVNDNEHLYRQIFSPIHYDIETNTLTAAAFDDASNKGLSVNRDPCITETEVRLRAKNRADAYNEANPEKPYRAFAGVIKFLCGEIRKITAPTERMDSVRGYAVYDTAYEADISHADICQIIAEKKRVRSVRSRLMDIANNYLASNSI